MTKCDFCEFAMMNERGQMVPKKSCNYYYDNASGKRVFGDHYCYEDGSCTDACRKAAQDYKELLMSQNTRTTNRNVSVNKNYKGR